MQQLRNSAPKASTTDAFGNSSGSAFNDFVMGLMQQQQIHIQNIVMGWCLKVQEQCDGFSAKNEDIEKFGWKTGRTDELCYLPTCSSCARLCLGLLGSLVPSWFPCFSVCGFCMTLSGSMYHTLSLTVFTCTTCQQSKPHQRNRFFSRGHDPFTLACKARPPLTDVWTFLSVIVIVIHSSGETCDTVFCGARLTVFVVFGGSHEVSDGDRHAQERLSYCLMCTYSGWQSVSCIALFVAAVLTSSDRHCLCGTSRDRNYATRERFWVSLTDPYATCHVVRAVEWLEWRIGRDARVQNVWKVHAGLLESENVDTEICVDIAGEVCWVEFSMWACVRRS